MWFIRCDKNSKIAEENRWKNQNGFHYLKKKSPTFLEKKIAKSVKHLFYFLNNLRTHILLKWNVDNWTVDIKGDYFHHFLKESLFQIL